MQNFTTFRYKGSPRTNRSTGQKIRINGILCGVRMWAKVFFRFVIMHAFEGQTNGQTERHSQYRALHYMQSHEENQSEIGKLFTKLACGLTTVQLFIRLLHYYT